jgi:Angiotensin-converting enzyme/Peptidase family M3
MTEASKVVSEAQAFVDKFNEEYETKHRNFENQFWGTKMALADPQFTASNLTAAKKAKEDMLSDYGTVEKAQALKDSLPADVSPKNLQKCLDIIIRTCKCYATSPAVKAIREELSMKESQLEMERNRMELGYTDPHDKSFHSLSSVGLRNIMVTNKDEATRKAAYEGLRSIGPFVLDHGFVDIVKLRNKMAKELGFVDYYDMKVTRAEGMSKRELFEVLDTLEESTRGLMEKSLKDIEDLHGPDALLPYNTGYMLSGAVTEKLDPFFPFARAPESYIRSYSALSITYAGSKLNLDLLERKNKYSNGFCHWPQVAWMKPDGSWQPSTANFTSLADPTAVGSGLRAIQVLMHEAGHGTCLKVSSLLTLFAISPHLEKGKIRRLTARISYFVFDLAAHFANIKQPSPLFGQEHAPFSAALAEGQSMFLDALVNDSAWRAKYARDRDGNPIPFDIIEEEIKATHPFKVRGLRSMLCVPYFEKALYELPEDEVTADRVQALADEVELNIQGGLSARPLLSVPHIISDEASCYYHSYVLAEMSVHQTREYILARDGYIVDNPKVGPTLASAYWVHGNSVPFLKLVADLTGKQLSGAPWTAELQRSVADAVSEARKDYDKALKEEEEEKKTESADVDLDMTIRFVDGDTVISDSSEDNKNALIACQEFEAYVVALIGKKKEKEEEKKEEKKEKN